MIHNQFETNVLL